MALKRRLVLASAFGLAGCPRAETEIVAPSLAASALPATSVASAANAPSAKAEAAASTPADPAKDASKTSAGGASAGLPPLAGERTIQLEVPEFPPAVVSVPVGATRARPVAIALHGNFDRPEWQCGVWGTLIERRGFVVCPRGVARRDVPKSLDRWEYASAKAMAGEIEAALGALAARFGPHADPGPVLFIGFSLGAIYGAPLVQRQPARFPRAVFIEGGLGAWTRSSAQRFAAAGGSRLLLACGQGDCMGRVKTLGPTLERAGLPTRFGGDPKAGHTYDGSVAAVVAEHWAWLVEGDPRWSEAP